MKIFSVIGLLLSAHVLLPNTLHAAWIGVFLYQTPVTDHVHMAIADDYGCDASEWNMWNETSKCSTKFKYEMEESSNWTIFWVRQSKEELQDLWNRFFTNVYDARSFFSKNCAYATMTMMEKILGRNLTQHRNWSHVLLLLWLPVKKGMIPLPDAVFKQIRRTLKEEQIPYYTPKQTVDFSQNKKSE